MKEIISNVAAGPECHFCNPILRHFRSTVPAEVLDINHSVDGINSHIVTGRRELKRQGFALTQRIFAEPKQAHRQRVRKFRTRCWKREDVPALNEQFIV